MKKTLNIDEIKSIVEDFQHHKKLPLFHKIVTSPHPLFPNASDRRNMEALTDFYNEFQASNIFLLNPDHLFKLAKLLFTAKLTSETDQLTFYSEKISSLQYKYFNKYQSVYKVTCKFNQLSPEIYHAITSAINIRFKKGYYTNAGDAACDSSIAIDLSTIYKKAKTYSLNSHQTALCIKNHINKRRVECNSYIRTFWKYCDALQSKGILNSDVLELFITKKDFDCTSLSCFINQASEFGFLSTERLINFVMGTYPGLKNENDFFSAATLLHKRKILNPKNIDILLHDVNPKSVANILVKTEKTNSTSENGPFSTRRHSALFQDPSTYLIDAIEEEKQCLLYDQAIRP